MLDEADFTKLQEAVSEKVNELCRDLLAGKIAVRPKKSGDTSACTWCNYKGICQFDPIFEGCDYERI